MTNVGEQQDYNFELPRNIERYLAALSKLYEQNGQRILQKIIVNAKIKIHEAWMSDNWNGGQYGHALYLILPEVIFLSYIKKKATIQKHIVTDINSLNNIQNEYIAEVFIEMEMHADYDWRSESGLVLEKKKIVSRKAEDRIWEDGFFRVFLSHKSEEKKLATEIKNNLKLLKISCFVAHEDIQPTKEWQVEIENALLTMDALVALMTNDFHNSTWTDHEVGFAIGRGIKVIPIRLGCDPYGLIGKYQAISCELKEVPVQIIKSLIDSHKMVNVFIEAVKNCINWEQGNFLAAILPSIDVLDDEQVLALIKAYNTNNQVRGSHGFTGQHPNVYGKGLLYHLQRITGKIFSKSSTGMIQMI